MKSQMLYLDDPGTLNFEANALVIWRSGDDKWCIQLDRSYFYPTGGGQEHDTGMIAEAKVLDVYKQGEPPILVHVTDRPVSAGSVACRIDSERRLRHMQHHTAQHLLTQCFVHLFNLETLSANINGYSPSTLDLPTVGLLPGQLAQAENLANKFIYENRPVRSYFVKPDQLATLPLRHSPKVKEDIRIIEIDGFDYTPCGGTHCTATGQIGVVKIVKTEKQTERSRVHFVSGWQALQLFQTSFETVNGLANQMSLASQDLPAAFLRLSDQLQLAQKELQSLRLERCTWEAVRLFETADTIAGRNVVMAYYSNRPTTELRGLGVELGKNREIIAVLTTVDGSKLTIVVACGENTGLPARDLILRLLAPFNGRGGGDARLAQGGGNVSKMGDVETLMRRIVEESIF